MRLHRYLAKTGTKRRFQKMALYSLELQHQPPNKDEREAGLSGLVGVDTPTHVTIDAESQSLRSSVVKPLIILEMNEINYDYLQDYIRRGRLSNFANFFDRHGFCQTTSETEYDILEPWIQWVSARTGLTYDEHKIFRLGDIVNSEFPQHWETLEARGYKVAAISPINGVNRTKSSPFWIPDPWVDTHTSGSDTMREFAQAIKQAVNDNASERLSTSTKMTLAKVMLTKTKVSSWPFYFHKIVGALKGQHWSKATILDRLLADLFLGLWRVHRPDFATLFLNAGAHIQHHYLFNSAAYPGSEKNPSWYINGSEDPVLEIYELYDTILGEILNLGVRVIVGTGLRQVPHESVTFYYRLLDHEGFLDKIGINGGSVSPRMSRDFLVEFSDVRQADLAENILVGLQSEDKTRVFEVDNRGKSLFVTLSYPNEILPGSKLFDDTGRLMTADFYSSVAFVAIKNGQHSATGYFMDTDCKLGELPKSISLEDIYHRTMRHFA